MTTSFGSIKRLLVTGASGFVGSYITLLARDKWDVWGTYHRYAHVQKHVNPLFLDLSKLSSIETCLDKVQPDVIIHAAAIRDVDYCESNRDLAFQVNAVSTEILAGLAAKRKLRLVYLSSDMVFDGFKGRYIETDEASPLNYYGQTKLESEKSVIKHCPDSVVARCALVYGHSLNENLAYIDILVERIKKKEQINLFYDQYRTPVFVYDLAAALLELASNNFFGMIHLGGKDRISRFRFAEDYVKINNLPNDGFNPVLMNSIPEQKNRPMDASMQCDLAKKVLETPLRGIEDGIRACRKFDLTQKDKEKY